MKDKKYITHNLMGKKETTILHIVNYGELIGDNKLKYTTNSGVQIKPISEIKETMINVIGFDEIIIPKEEAPKYPKTFKELFENTDIKPTIDEKGNIHYNFKAIMKEEPKQTLEKYSERFDNDKSPIGNPETWGKRTIDDSKQETLEAAEQYSKQFNYAEDSDAYNDFIAGAKWQKERSYSQEEVLTIAKDTYIMGRNNLLISEFNIWVEQFSKLKNG